MQIIQFKIFDRRWVMAYSRQLVHFYRRPSLPYPVSEMISVFLALLTCKKAEDSRAKEKAILLFMNIMIGLLVWSSRGKLSKWSRQRACGSFRWQWPIWPNLRRDAGGNRGRRECSPRPTRQRPCQWSSLPTCPTFRARGTSGSCVGPFLPPSLFADSWTSRRSVGTSWWKNR